MSRPSESDRAPSLTGRVVGRYRLTRVLGSGGMGTVYEAEDTSLGRRVALKVLGGDVVAAGERRARFFREARGAAAATHENIAAVYEVGESEGLVFLAMELVDGHTLREVLSAKAGGLPVEEILRVGRAIARALVKAHGAGVIHRDLKPENIMLGEERRVKILDFGIAKLRGDLESAAADRFATQEGRILGTPAYMSPEQAAGRPVDERSDLFSLGVVLYEMATGRTPFEAETPMLTLVAVTRDEPPPPSSHRTGLPASLEEVIMGCLRKDPALRPPSARRVVADLERAMEHPGASTTASIPPGEAAPIPAPRRSAIEDAPTLLDAGAPAGNTTGAPTGNTTGAPNTKSIPSRRTRALAASGVAVIAAIVAGLFAQRQPPPSSDGRATAQATVSEAPSAPPPSAPRLRRLTYTSDGADIETACISEAPPSVVYMSRGIVYRQGFTSETRRPVETRGIAAVKTMDCLPGGDLLIEGADAQKVTGLFRVHADGRAPSLLRRESARTWLPSHDGARVIRLSEDGLYVEALDGQEEPRRVMSFQRGVRPDVLGASWSPDDKRLALILLTIADRGNETSLLIVPVDGQGPVAELRDPRWMTLGGSSGVAWLDPGRLIVALANESNEAEGTGLYILPVGPELRVPDSASRVAQMVGQNASELRYDPVGKRLVLLGGAFQQDVYTATLLDGGRRLGPTARVSLSDTNDRPTDWLPDGRILFMSDRTGSWDVMAQRPGGEPESLLSGPTWQTWAQAVSGGVVAFDVEPTSRDGKCSVVRREANGSARRLLDVRCESDFSRAGRPPPTATQMLCLRRSQGRCLVREPSDKSFVLQAFDGRTGERLGEPVDTGVPASKIGGWTVSADEKDVIFITHHRGEVTWAPLSGDRPPTTLNTPLLGPHYVTAIPGQDAVIVTGGELGDDSFGMIRVEKTGRVDRLLGSTRAWMAQPTVSVDGKTLAYGRGVYNSSVWILDGL